MKKWISLLLAAAMVLTLIGCGKIPQIKEPGDLMNGIQASPVQNVDISEDAPALLDFYLNLSRKTSGDGNMLISPLSVLSALAMTANGAKGETLAQMEKAFGMELSKLNSWMHSYLESLPETEESSLKLANSIWFTDHQSFTPVESFLQTNADYYGAGIYQTPFDATALTAINNWVAAHTDGMIKNILDRIPKDAVIYLVNALAFEGQWLTAYEEHQVREGIFTMTDGTERSVSMMHGEENIYLEDDQATGFVKYYKGGDYAFVALLPKEGITPAEYLHELTDEALMAMLENPQYLQVFSAIPKFEMSYSVEMSEVLKALGMADAFDAEKADFTGLGTSTVGNVCINRVLHKTAITVAEQGTKAGASTVVEMRAEGATAIEDYKEVTLDKPFVYMLIDSETGMPFFIGILEDPAQTVNEAKIQNPILKEPPLLEVRCEDQAVTVLPSNYCWDYAISEDQRSAVNACGAHPLQFDIYPMLEISSGEVKPMFAQMPNHWEVSCWHTADHGNTDAPAVPVTKTETGFLPNSGDCIYVIYASWDTPEYNGTAEYAFKIQN